MNDRIQLACVGLTASACVLAGLLAVAVFHRSQQANAEMVVPRDDFSLMTAQSRDGEEALYLLDNASGQLLVYEIDITRERIELAGSVPLAQLFQAGGGDAGGRGTGRTPR